MHCGNCLHHSAFATLHINAIEPEGRKQTCEPELTPGVMHTNRNHFKFFRSARLRMFTRHQSLAHNKRNLAGQRLGHHESKSQ